MELTEIHQPNLVNLEVVLEEVSLVELAWEVAKGLICSAYVSLNYFWLQLIFTRLRNLM